MDQVRASLGNLVVDGPAGSNARLSSLFSNTNGIERDNITSISVIHLVVVGKSWRGDFIQALFRNQIFDVCYMNETEFELADA